MTAKQYGASLGGDKNDLKLDCDEIAHICKSTENH